MTVRRFLHMFSRVIFSVNLMAFLLPRTRRKRKLLILILISSFVSLLLFLRGQKASSILHRHTSCPEYFLPHHNNTWKYGECLPHKASEESCRMVKNMYKLNPDLAKCKSPPSRTICAIKPLPATKDSTINFVVKCDISVCSKSESIRVLHVKDGSMNEAGSFMNDTIQLEEGLVAIIRENIDKKKYFVILRCKEYGKTGGISQILFIDPLLTVRRNETRPRDKNLLNVNILLIDSVSRAHFYRSLPKSIAAFKTLRDDTAKAQIFDFELFQAVEGHTAENTHALFNGKLMPLGRSNSRHSVNPGNMFGTFNKAGYQTVWQEDLCWKGIWGLMLDLVAGSWKHLQERLNQHFIDHSGITDVGCEILGYIYGINSPFMGPPGEQICYDGRFQHSYLLNYTLDTIRAIDNTPSALPLLSYMSLSVGHDHIGRRIQTLDSALVDYVNELSVSEDTITIILSDHGNTYTSYTVSIQEGRFEMFHPHLFMIIPNKVARRLGEDALNALRINQHRLVTIMDLHHSVMALAQPLTGRVRPKGVFAPIPAERTCNDVELRRPNLCVCQGWDTPTTNDDLKAALVEFALGQMNNQIETQLGKYSAKSKEKLPSQRSCVRLRAIRFNDVRERRDATRASLITSMIIYVPAGDVVSQKEELFHVEMESRDNPRRRSLDMNLLQFDRITMYGPYASCAGKGISLKLCVCSKRTSFNATAILAPPNPSYLGTQTVTRAGTSACIYLISRTHSSISFAYDLANICDTRGFVVLVDVESRAMKLSRDCPFNVTLRAANVKFLLSARKEHSHWLSSIKVLTRISEYGKHEIVH